MPGADAEGVREALCQFVDAKRERAKVQREYPAALGEACEASQRRISVAIEAMVACAAYGRGARDDGESARR